MRGHDAIHSSILAPIVGAALGGPYEGRPKRMSAARWLTAHSRDSRAGAAVRCARGGGEGACLRAVGGLVRRLRPVEAAGAG